MQVDINADMGEGLGPWSVADDAALVPLLSSANIACGYHAGDAEIMARTVTAARACGCEVGAHIGLPDLIGFGRRRMEIDGARFTSHVLYQLGALQAIARAAGHRVTHLSFHGALGDMASLDADLAAVLVGAVARYDGALVISTSPGTQIMAAARRLRLRTVGIFAADRAYRADGRLVPRSQPGSVISDPDLIARRVVRLLEDQRVEAVDGSLCDMPARTLMVHSDGPNAVVAARAVRAAVEACGGAIVPMSKLA